MKLFTFLCFLAPFQLFAQSEVVSGKIADWNTGSAGKLFMHKITGSDSLLLDSVQVSPQGEFSFKAKSYYKPGEYVLSTKGGKGNYFLGEATTVKFSGNLQQYQNGFAQVSGGKENQLYRQILAKHKRLTFFQDSIKRAVERFDMFDEKFTTKTGKMKQTARDSVKVFNKYINEIQSKEKGSFAAEVVGQLLKSAIKDELVQWDTLYDNNLSFQYNKYFMYVNFADGRVANSRFLFPKIKEYFTQYVKRTDENFKKTIKKVFELSNANGEVKHEVNGMIMKHFIETTNIPIVTWLKNEGFTDCEAPEISAKDKMKMDRMERLSPGKVSPDVELPNTNDVPTKLSSIKGKKAVVVMFWASWCHHCLQETPKIHEMYKNYKKQGLEVYAISLDSKKEDWIDAVKKMGFEWINVSDLLRWESPAARKFMVAGTPTIYILDDTFTIKSIVKTYQGLKEELDEMGFK